jgi:hypothetical protein
MVAGFMEAAENEDFRGCGGLNWTNEFEHSLAPLLTTQALPFYEFHTVRRIPYSTSATPTAPCISSNYHRFQQIGESALRSKLTPMR